MKRTILLSSPSKTLGKLWRSKLYTPKLCTSKLCTSKLWMLGRGAAILGGEPASWRACLRLAAIALSVSLLLLLASDPGVGDWPMWGGTPDRNMVSPMKGIPTTWDVASKKNVKWVGQLGSQSYGNPVVAGGQVYAGTNNELVRNPKEGGDRGVLMCFRESDGKFLWQHTNEKLPAGRANDSPYQGVCSSPMVEGDKVYYVTNRCEIVCLDSHGDGSGG